MSKQFKSFKFASFSQVNDQNVKKFGNSGNSKAWHTISEGLSLFGICKNKNCQAYKQRVYVTLGFGQFHMSYKIRNTPCVMCKSNLKKVQSAVIYKGCLIGEGQKASQIQQNQTQDESSNCQKIQDSKRKYFQYQIFKNDSYFIFGQLQKQIISWNYLILKSTPKHLCKKQHELSQFKSVQNSWTCNECNKQYLKPDKSKCCQMCDYNVCYQCL